MKVSTMLTDVINTLEAFKRQVTDPGLIHVGHHVCVSKAIMCMLVILF